jgi:hypothetical protein
VEITVAVPELEEVAELLEKIRPKHIVLEEVGDGEPEAVMEV